MEGFIVGDGICVDPTALDASTSRIGGAFIKVIDMNATIVTATTRDKITTAFDMHLFLFSCS